MSQSIRNSTKTTRSSKLNLQRTWYLVDASKAPLGRVASLVAQLLTGKNRADYAQDTDMGGVVTVINADKVVLTGMKPEKKVYFKHSGAIGGISHKTFQQQMEKDSSVVVYRAVSGMLPKNRHRDLRLNNRLHIFGDATHNHPNQMVAAN